MTRLLTLAALFATAVIADDTKPGVAITEIKLDKDDKFETKGGRPAEPTKVTSADELAKAIPDEATRKRVAKLVDFKTHTLLVFAWQGSGQDKLETLVQESYPEQVVFTYKPGRTKDLRTHVHLFALRNNVKWVAK